MSWTSVLLDWFFANKRVLPWREHRTPYRVWVSEVMLQQTKVEVVKPYFESWMERFPTFEAVAEASEEAILMAWQGLGYYSRARHLQAGIQEVVHAYKGEVPRTRKELEAIEGIGPYTAGAILSLAFNLPEVAVDGNVLRVYARLYDIHEDILSTKGKKKITFLVEETLPKEAPAAFNEALMDFGATICIPKYPKCSSCPISTSCKAYQAGTVEKLPIRLKKTNVHTVKITSFLVEWQGRFLLHKRSNEGLLRDMWEFPSFEGVKGKEKLIAELGAIGVHVRVKGRAVDTATHVFSHRKWNITLYKVVVDNVEEAHFADWRWVKKEEFTTLPWAGPHGKFTSYVT